MTGTASAWVSVDGDGTGVAVTDIALGESGTSYDAVLTCEGAEFTLHLNVVDFNIEPSYGILAGGSRTIGNILPAGHESLAVSASPEAGWITSTGAGVRIENAQADGSPYTVSISCEGASASFQLTVAGPNLPGFDHTDPDVYAREIVSTGVYHYEDIVPEGATVESVSVTSGDSSWVSVDADGRGIIVSPNAPGAVELTFTMTSDDAQINLRLTVVGLASGELELFRGNSTTLAAVGGTGHALAVSSDPSEDWITVAGSVLSISDAVQGRYVLSLTVPGEPCAVTDPHSTIILTVSGPAVPPWLEEISENEYRGVLVTGGYYDFADLMGGAEITVTDGPSWAVSSGTGLLMHPDARGQYTVTLTSDNGELTLHLEVRDLRFGRYVIPDGGDLEVPGLVPEGHPITDIEGPRFALIHGDGISIRGADSGTWVITYWCDGAQGHIDLRVVGFGIDDEIHAHPGDHIEVPDITDGAIDIEGPDWVAPDDHGTGMVIDVGNTTGSYDVVITSEGVTKSIRIIVTDDTSSGGDFGSFLLLAILIATLISITVYATVRDYKKRQQLQP